MGSNESYGARIRYWRERAGITKGELAEAVGVTEPAIYHWESERYPPTLEHLQAVASAVGVDMRMFWSPISRGLP